MIEVELEDYRAKKHWVVFEVDLDDNTPMCMVSEAAGKILKLPNGMHYRLRLLAINFYELNLVI